MWLGEYGKLVNVLRTYPTCDLNFSTQYLVRDLNDDMVTRHTFKTHGMRMIPGTELLVERCDRTMILLTMKSLNQPLLSAHITIVPGRWRKGRALHVTCREFKERRFRVRASCAHKPNFNCSLDGELDTSGKRSPWEKPGLLRLQGWQPILDYKTSSWFDVRKDGFCNESGPHPVRPFIRDLLLPQFGAWIYGPYAVLTTSPLYGLPPPWLPVDKRRDTAFYRAN